MLRQRIPKVQSVKSFQSYLRCAVYPDVTAFEAEREQVEQAWPAYADDTPLCRPPDYAWEALSPAQGRHLHAADDFKEWYAEGKRRLSSRAERLQYVLARMNHHIHPLVDTATGERRPLQSCQPKNRPKEWLFFMFTKKNILTIRD